MPAKEGRHSGPCSRCGGTGVVIQPQGAHAHASVCDCSRNCLECRNSGYLYEKDAAGREVARICGCETRRVRTRHYNEAGVPAKYYDARLNESTQDRENHEAHSTLLGMAKDYTRGMAGIVLMGQPGTGKTWLVAGFIHELIFRHGVPTVFRDFFHLLADLRSGYSSGTPESELINPLVDVEVLVVDELGKGRNTPWEQNILDVIISQRYNNQKTTLFTSNYTRLHKTTLKERVRPKEAPGGDADREVSDTLQERVGPRIYSRLKEMCHFVDLDGKDRRENHSGTAS